MLKSLLIVGLVLPSLLVSQTPAPGCDFVADIAFIFDVSGSVSNTELNQVKSLVKMLIDNLDVDDAKQKVRVGVGRFSTSGSITQNLGAYANAAQLKNNVDAVGNTSGGTNISAGLTAGANILNQGTSGNSPGTRMTGTDADVPRIIFILGDGQGSLSDTLVANIKAGGLTSGNPVMIFGVFVGNPVTQASGINLFKTRVVSSPPDDWFRQVDSFNDVMAVSAQIVQQFCAAGSSVLGDVHFVTTDGVMYTFNGAGDYIYTQSDKIDIHVRDIYVGRATALAAMAVNDKETGSVLELWWDGLASEDLKVNIRHKNEGNKLLNLTERDTRNPFNIYRAGPGHIVIKHPKYPAFSVSAYYGGRASFRVNLPHDWKTRGLGGNNNGKVEDDICDRSGLKCASLNATNAEVHQIGLDWAVLPSELLFEKWMSKSTWELQYHALETTGEQMTQARRVCGNVQPCIYDYISTGSEEYAKHTKRDYMRAVMNDAKLVYVGDQY